jgi:hypothetical protein
MNGYDGSINIDTKVDEKGFNNATKDMSKKFKDIDKSASAFGKAVTSVGKSGATAFKAISSALIEIGFSLGVVIALVAAVVIAFVGLIAIIGSSVRQFFKLEDTAQDIKLAFENLKLAFATAFSGLVAAATPSILTVINGSRDY